MQGRSPTRFHTVLLPAVRGYGTLAWGFIGLILVPLVVVVPYRAWKEAQAG